MAHPKRRQSRQEEISAELYYKAADQQLAVCPTTGEAHLYHRATGMKENFTTRVKW